MAHHHVHAVAMAQVLRQLLGQVDRAMVAASAAERYRQVFEAAFLVVADACVHQRQSRAQSSGARCPAG